MRPPPHHSFGRTLATVLVLSLLPALPAAAQSPGWGQGSTGGAPGESGILAQFQEIDQELTRVRLAMLELEDQARELTATRTRHADELASADAQLAQQRAAVATQLATLYRLHRRGLARVVFGADDPAELRRRGTYLMSIIDACNDRMNAFLSASAARKDLVATADRDMNALGALRTELQLKEAELKDRRGRRLVLLEQIRSQRDVASRAMSDYGAVRENLGSQLGGGTWNSGWTGAANSTTPQAAPAPRPSGQVRATTFRSANGRLPWPTTGRVVRRFGTYTDPRTGQPEDSRGLDLAADYGTPVRAVFAGQVKLADYVPGYGQTVAIEHGPYSTVYAHLSSPRVQSGQSVREGQTLGLVGNSGLTDGGTYMLTFEIRYNGTPQDPLPWLSRR
jgi:murein hydrolase activator